MSIMSISFSKNFENFFPFPLTHVKEGVPFDGTPSKIEQIISPGAIIWQHGIKLSAAGCVGRLVGGRIVGVSDIGATGFGTALAHSELQRVVGRIEGDILLPHIRLQVVRNRHFYLRCPRRIGERCDGEPGGRAHRS